MRATSAACDNDISGGKTKEMKVRVPKQARLTRFLLSPWGKFLLISAALVTVAGLGTFTYFYTKYSHLIDQQAAGRAHSPTHRRFSRRREP